MLSVRLSLAIWVAVAAAMASTVLPPPAASAAPPGPREVVRLVDVDHNDSTLRGRFVSADYFLPGPGDYSLARTGSSLEVVYSSSDLVTPDSILSVLWNGIPLSDRTLIPSTERQTFSIPLPTDGIRPAVNRLEVRALLRLRNETCGDDNNPARHLTVYGQTAVRYAYADHRPVQAPVAPDLARYPWPFFQPNPTTAADVAFLLPARPSREELEAAAGVSARLGRFAGGKPLVMRAAEDAGSIPVDLVDANLIYVGKVAGLPGLRAARDLPIQIGADGSLAPTEGAPAEPDTGVIMEYPSPTNPARMALAVTGATDEAVLKAGRALSTHVGPRLLGGTYALVTDLALGSAASPDAAPVAALAAPDGTDGTVSGTVTGVGEHTLSFTLDTPGVVQNPAGLPLDLVVSHSALLDRGRSSVRVILNGLPLTSVALKDVAPTRGSALIDLPSAAVRPGGNKVDLRFSLELPSTADGDVCARPPNEQAWAVVHPETSVRLSGALAPPSDVTLASYPYPFVERGGMDHTVFVVPGQVDLLGPVLQLAADLGRSARDQYLAPRVMLADGFQPGTVDANLVLLGTPTSNPMLGQLGEHLPLAVDQGEYTRFAFTDRLRLAARNAADLGIVQEIPSPWAPGRFILVVSSTTEDGLPLSVRALSQPGLAGNLALIGRGVPQAPTDPRVLPTPTPEARVPDPLQVTTYRLRPTQQVTTGRDAVLPLPSRLPVVMAAAAALLAVVATLAMAYQAFLVQKEHP